MNLASFIFFKSSYLKQLENFYNNQSLSCMNKYVCVLVFSYLHAQFELTILWFLAALGFELSYFFSHSFSPFL
jgi:hypothetical protein